MPRRVRLELTDYERRLLLRAISEHTEGNARDLSEMKAAGWYGRTAQDLVKLESKIAQTPLT